MRDIESMLITYRVLEQHPYPILGLAGDCHHMSGKGFLASARYIASYMSQPFCIQTYRKQVTTLLVYIQRACRTKYIGFCVTRMRTPCISTESLGEVELTRNIEFRLAMELREHFSGGQLLTMRSYIKSLRSRTMCIKLDYRQTDNSAVSGANVDHCEFTS